MAVGGPPPPAAVNFMATIDGCRLFNLAARVPTHGAQDSEETDHGGWASITDEQKKLLAASRERSNGGDAVD